MTGLLEREEQLRRIDAALRACSRGHGEVLLVHGPAGVGVSALCRAAAARAGTRGVSVLAARGSAPEHTCAFGVVRRLFDRPLHAPLRGPRAPELATAVADATALLGTAVAASAPPFAAEERLAALAAALARTAPLLLVIDDARWADRASVRCLAHLGERAAGLPLLLVLGVTAGRPLDPELHTMLHAAIHDGRRLAPEPLSEPATARWIRDAHDAAATPAFCRACRDATGGMPFFVEALVAALAEAAVPGDDDHAAIVPAVRSAAIAYAVEDRLAELPGPCAPVARAAAVLGDAAEPRLVAALAEMPLDAVADAADALGAAGLLTGRGATLAFSQPVVRSAITAGIAPGEWSRDHAAAARLLADEAAPAAVAEHLLDVTPAGDGWVVGRLRGAAVDALGHGAPEQAARYLNRALHEPPAGRERAAVLRELGRAELLLRTPAAAVHLTEALERTGDPGGRAEIGRDLLGAVVHSAALADVDAEARRVAAAIGAPADRSEALDLAVASVCLRAALFDPDRAATARRRLARLLPAARDAGDDGRPLRFLAALDTAVRTGSAAAVRTRAGDDLFPLTAADVEGTAAVDLASALVLVDELGRATQVLGALAARAAAAGSTVAAAGATGLRAFLAARRGALREAEAHARLALAASDAHDLPPDAAWAATLLALTLLAQGRADDATAVLAARSTAVLAEPARALADVAHAELALAAGRRDDAIDALRAVGDRHERAGIRAPVVVAWRSRLALMLPAANRDEALELVSVEGARARTSGQARAIGGAHRAAGLLARGAEAVDLLRESVAVLATSPARLDEARARVDLGAALRRSGHPADARPILHSGAELAERCGATALAATAVEELHAAGGRRRDGRPDDRDALTPTEARIGRMAASGQSNREIAEALFLAPKTVEMHLTRVYRKAGVRSRTQLAARLAHER